MTKPKLTYYNYFLFLSLILIAGYMMTSLFFLNRTNDSGKQAVQCGRTVERTNAIIQQTYHLESLGYGYLLNGCEDTYSNYHIQKVNLLAGYDTLKLHCERFDLAFDHAVELQHLVKQRVTILDDLIHQDSLHSMKKESRIEHMSSGSHITDSIIVKLKQIREVNNEYRIDSQLLASNYNRNAMFMLSVFGIVMLFIVFISFNKMKKAILENQRNAQEISQINLELKSMNENLENFAYVASHDLNEPLRKIRTFGDLVRSEMDNESFDEKLVVSHIERMQSASKRMQQLINDLLSYSRVSRDFNLMNSVDLENVVTSVLSDLEVRIKESGIKINVDELPKNIKVDEIQMRQLFQNLISNAIKFRGKEKTSIIEISSSKIESNEVPYEEVTELIADKYWKINVKDNGIGFDQQYANKIFAVFQRLHGRSTYEGTGIGLSICKKICENHKGFIAVSSKEGEGSIFSIYLPIKQ
jgi:signal transduction histidine kinase